MDAARRCPTAAGNRIRRFGLSLAHALYNLNLFLEM